MDQGKWTRLIGPPEHAATARDHARDKSVSVAERRRAPMIHPRNVYGVTITGTRKLEDVPADTLRDVFLRTTKPFNGPNTKWYVGGAIGIDTAFLRWITPITKGYVWVVVPKKLTDQPQAAQDAIRWAMHYNHDVRLMELDSKNGSPECYFERNRWMVEHSQAVIGFPHESEPSNGTHYTLQYAQSLGLPRIIWPVGK